MRSTIFMFDLEMTIVNSWNSGCPLFKKINFINNFINNMLHNFNQIDLNNVKFGIFSFAIDFPHEKSKGIDLASHIKREIDPNFVTCFQELEALCKFEINSLQKWELVSLFGKEGMFQIYCSQFPENDFILFDDSLQFKTQTIKRDEQMLTLIKV